MARPGASRGSLCRLVAQSGSSVRFDYGEERLVTLGRLAGRLVVIAHASRDDGTRIISMRKGNRREQEIYQKRLGAD